MITIWKIKKGFILLFFSGLFLTSCVLWAGEAIPEEVKQDSLEPFAPSLAQPQQEKPVEIEYKDLPKEALLENLQIEKERITVVEGQSHILKFAKKIHRISVSNPTVLDFISLSPNEILLNAKQYGSVNLIVWDIDDKLSSFDINVIRDAGVLDQLLKQIDPEGHFEIFPSRDVFVVRGDATSVKKVELIKQAVENFAKGSVSLVRVKNVKQILLQTRFVQVDHTRNHDFGVDFESTKDATTKSYMQRFMPGSTHATNNTDISYAGNFHTFAGLLSQLASTNTTQDLYQLYYFDDKHQLSAFIKAIEENDLGKTIARPNLLAKDGEEASFLVGGETAILVTTNNQLNIQYREFGTRLKFKPEIMDDGEIRMEIEPEVSTVNSANGVTVGTDRVPGFSTTRVKTVVQLRNGQTLVIGGLIQQILTTDETGVPYLRRIPVLGKLFQSYNRDWKETELIVIVTPNIVKPEDQPLGDNKKDMLSKATALVDSIAKPEDPQALAIKYVVNEHKRWKELEQMEQEIKNISFDLKKNPPDQKKELTKPVVTPVGGSVKP